MLKSRNLASLTAAALAMSVAFAACTAPEEDVQEIPEVTEVEQDEDTGARELERETVLGPGDEGETILATGWVEGKPLDNGFFLRTEFNRIVFIETTQDVAAGESVRVQGQVRRSDAEAFNGWEVGALGDDLKPDLDLWRGIHLQAQTVEKIEGPARRSDEPARDPGR
jgi:hypothetical protein